VEYLFKWNICSSGISVQVGYLFKRDICSSGISVQVEYLFKWNNCSSGISVQVEYLIPRQRDISGNQWDKMVKVKWSRYRAGVAQRVRKGITLLFHDRVTRRGWVVSNTPRPYFTSGKDPVPILQEAGWVPGPGLTSEKSLPHRDSMPDRPARTSVAILTELRGPQISEMAQ